MLTLATIALAVDYTLILWNGQSLAIGNSTGSCLSTTQPYSNKTLSGTDPQRTGTSLVDLICTASVEPPHISMANHLSSLNGGAAYPIISATHGIGGTAYSGIKRTPTAPSLPVTGTTAWLNLQTQATNAKNAITGSDSIAWRLYVLKHGESDYTNSMLAADYAAAILEMRADAENDRVRLGVWTDNGTRLPILTDQIQTWRAQVARVNPVTAGGAESTPVGQWIAARDHPGKVYLVGPTYQYSYTDSLHFTADSARWAGAMFAKVAHQLLTTKRPWVPLAPRSITLEGSTITVRLWVPSGCVVVDYSTRARRGACTSGQPCAGFEFIDDSSSAFINGDPVASSCDTLTIPLSATPSGANPKLRYAYRADGHVDTSTGAYGNIRDEDSSTSLYGHNLYNWLVMFNEPIGFTWTPWPERTIANKHIFRGASR